MMQKLAMMKTPKVCSCVCVWVCVLFRIPYLIEDGDYMFFLFQISLYVKSCVGPLVFASMSGSTSTMKTAIAIELNQNPKIIRVNQTIKE